MPIKKTIERNKDKINNEINLLMNDIDFDNYKPYVKHLDSGSFLQMREWNDGSLRDVRLILSIKNASEHELYKDFTLKIYITDNLKTDEFKMYFLEGFYISSEKDALNPIKEELLRLISKIKRDSSKITDTEGIKCPLEII